MYGLEPQRAAQRIDELIETFEMGDYVDELCENYSQGMKQRVVFRLGAGARSQGPGRRRASGRARPAERADRQGPVHHPGSVRAAPC